MSKKKSKKDIKAERKMLVSVINKQKKTEEKREKINIPETIKATNVRIKNLKLSEGSKLSSGGIGRWMSFVHKFSLEFKGHLWIPVRVSFRKIRNELINSKDNLLAYPEGLTDTDLKIILNRIEPTIEWLGRKIEEQNLEKEITNDIVIPISDDSIIKMRALCGIKKIEKLFNVLVEQGMLGVESPNFINQHFTESALKVAISEQTKPIEWKSKKYESVNFFVKLRWAGWIDASDKQISEHFFFKGNPLSITHHTIKHTDKLDRIEEILSKHLV